MTNEELAVLRELAARATPGPWIYRNERVLAGQYTIIGPVHQTFGDNGEYMAAANPQTVLKLVAEVERLQKVEAKLTSIYKYLERAHKAGFSHSQMIDWIGEVIGDG